MSKEKKTDNHSQEPWEQPIYDTEYDTTLSRAEQRKKKTGHNTFLTILIILIILIPLATIATYLYTKNANQSASKTDPTTVATTTSTTTKSSVSSSEKAVSDSQDEETTTSSSTQDAGTNTYTVQSGDTPYAIASQNGLSVSELFSLNGLSESEPIIPGQVLKLK